MGDELQAARITDGPIHMRAAAALAALVGACNGTSAGGAPSGSADPAGASPAGTTDRPPPTCGPMGARACTELDGVAVRGEVVVIPTTTAFAAGDLNADGVEDFVVVCTDAPDVEHESPADACAFDGRTFEMVWRTGPIAARPREPVHFAWWADWFVSVGPDGGFHVFDARTGERRSSGRLQADVGSACADPSGALFETSAGRKRVKMDAGQPIVESEDESVSCPPRWDTRSSNWSAAPVSHDGVIVRELPSKRELWRMASLGGEREGTTRARDYGFRTSATRLYAFSYPRFDVYEGRTGKLLGCVCHEKNRWPKSARRQVLAP